MQLRLFKRRPRVPLDLAYASYCTIPDAFTGNELDRILAYKGLVAPHPGMATGGFEHRRCTVRWLFPHTPGTEWLFERIMKLARQANRECFHLDLVEAPELQLTEYRAPGELYGGHVDAAYGKYTRLRRRKLSFTLQLSEANEYEGGDLRLYPETLAPITVHRRRGEVVLFRSHVIHEVTPVTRGVRDSLVTWIEGPELR